LPSSGLKLWWQLLLHVTFQVSSVQNKIQVLVTNVCNSKGMRSYKGPADSIFLLYHNLFNYWVRVAWNVVTLEQRCVCLESTMWVCTSAFVPSEIHYLCRENHLSTSVSSTATFSTSLLEDFWDIKTSNKLSVCPDSFNSVRHLDWQIWKYQKRLKETEPEDSYNLICWCTDGEKLICTFSSISTQSYLASYLLKEWSLWKLVRRSRTKEWNDQFSWRTKPGGKPQSVPRGTK
jgi:hypothetical protein